MTSIRRSTMTLVAATVSVLLIAGGLGLFTVVRAALVAGFDDGLEARAGAIQSLIRFDHGKVEIDTAVDTPRLGQSGAGSEYFFAWVRRGNDWEPLGSSASSKGQWPASPDAFAELHRAFDTPLPDNGLGRAICTEFLPTIESDDPAPASSIEPPQTNTPDVPRVRLLIVQPRAPLDAALASIAWSIVGVGILLIAATAAGAAWAVGRGLRPLDQMSRRVAAIGPESLNHRFDTDPLPSELRPIFVRLNEAFARLDEAFQRERRFTAGAAHELRTPLAEVRMLLEVALGKERTPERWKQTATEVLAVAGEAQALLEVLLSLARAMPAPAGVHTDLAAIVRREVARRAPATEQAGPELRVLIPDSAWIAGSEAAARAVVANLLDNAVRHGDKGTDASINVKVETAGVRTVLEVSNRASQLDPADVANVFEPFWRKDAARSPGSGLGLGLTLSRVLMQSASGTLDAHLNEDHRLIVRAEWAGIQAVPDEPRSSINEPRPESNEPRPCIDEPRP